MCRFRGCDGPWRAARVSFPPPPQINRRTARPGEYTSQRGKATRAKPDRRLAKTNGSSSLSEWPYSQAWQAQSGLGAAVAGRLYRGERNHWPTPAVEGARRGPGADKAAGQETGRGASPAPESGAGGAAINRHARAVRGNSLRSQRLSRAQTLIPGALSPHPRQPHFARFGVTSPVGHRDARPAAVYLAEVPGRLELGLY